MTTPVRLFTPWRPMGFFVGLFCLCLSFFPLTAIAAEAAKQKVDLPADTAEKSLKRLSEQTGAEVLYPTNFAKDVRTNPVSGEYTPREALTKMLDGTGLVAAQDEKTGALTVRKETPGEAKNGPSRPANDRAAGEETTGTIKLETFEVMGSKLLNMDKPRSRDDAQPYVVFSKDTITNSGATNLEDFLRNRLTMNSQAAANSQAANTFGNVSQVNLRGLGTANTLILIDGHRAPTFVASSQPRQPDLNGIPLGAIERIEILPATASGIYGGSAVGGVINVILRRDYAGLEVETVYENTFDTDAAIRRVNVSGGMTLEDGKTNILISGSYSDANPLTIQDRNFVQRGRATIFRNNPSFFLNATNPILGATTNIRAVGGVNLTLKNGGVALNSPVTFVPTGYTGPASDGGTALVANAGQYNFNLSSTSQLGGGGLMNLGSVPEIDSAMLAVRRDFNDKVQAFLELAAENNSSRTRLSSTTGVYTLQSTSQANPFNQAIVVTAPIPGAGADWTVRYFTRRAVGGIIVKLPADWKVESDYTWSQSRWAYVDIPAVFATRPDSAAVSAGTFEVLRDLRNFPQDFTPFISDSPRAGPLRSTNNDITVRAAGPVGSLPAGAPTIALSTEYRAENMNEGISGTFFVPSKSQSIASAYAEAQWPIISASNAFTGARELTLQIAGRWDQYMIHGATGFISPGGTILRTVDKTNSTDPTVGIRFVPVKSLTLRASYGTGFLPPNVSQLTQSTSAVSSLPAGTVIDPRRGNSPSNLGVFTVSGGNPALRPEKSKSWSAGVVFTPTPLPGLRVSLDYIRVEKRDNIATLSLQQVVNNESLLSGRVTRGPLDAGDPYSVGPITRIDQSSVNLASTLVEAWDGAVNYHLPVQEWGEFDFFALLTKQTHFRNQVIPGTPFVETVGVTTAAPLKLKGNLGITWTMGKWTAGWTMQYFDSYLVADPTTAASAVTFLNQGSTTVPSQVYHDFFATYRFPTATRPGRNLAGLLNNTEIQIGLKNAFNTEPPLDVTNTSNSAGYYSVYGSGRLRTYYVSIKKHF